MNITSDFLLFARRRKENRLTSGNRFAYNYESVKHTQNIYVQIKVRSAVQTKSINKLINKT